MRNGSPTKRCLPLWATGNFAPPFPTLFLNLKPQRVNFYHIIIYQNDHKNVLVHLDKLPLTIIIKYFEKNAIKQKRA